MPSQALLQEKTRASSRFQSYSKMGQSAFASSTTICIRISSWCSTEVMDYNELEKILSEYICRFDELDNTKTRNEGYKWRAIACFQRHWNIDADRDSFLQMFKAAMAKQTNLFDGQHKHPLGGIRKLLRERDDYDFVHRQFSLLFSDDGGDWNQRQERAQLFTEAMNGQLLRFFPTEKGSTHTLYDAINYLSFWRPEENFICKPASANKMANIIDFNGDIGWGEDFSLAEYYKMCSKILEALDDFPEVIKLNEARRLRESPYIDKTASRHIIVYDVIYCAYQYDLNGVKTRPSIPRNERIAAAEYQRRLDKKEAEIEAFREQLRMAESANSSLPDLSSQTVHHKSFGNGIVQSCTGERLTVAFQSKDRHITFEYSADAKRNCIMAGFITPERNDIVDEIRSFFDRVDEINRLSAQLLSAEKELNDLIGK